MHTAIIIPAYKEEQEIGLVVQQTIQEGYVPIVVDDGSKDKTGEIARLAGAIVLEHVVNLGKGAAAKTGCDFAIASGAKVLVLMDADGQHKPDDIKRVLKALKGCDIVFGYRKLNAKMPCVMRMGNLFINMTSSFINGIRLQDTQSGFRAMTAETYKKVRWDSTDYGMESEMIAKVARHKLAYKEIPIDTIYKDSFKGTTIFDGIRIVLRLLKWRYV